MTPKIKIKKLEKKHIPFVFALKSEPTAIAISGFSSPPEYNDIVEHVDRLVNLTPNISYVCSLQSFNVALITAEYNEKNKVISKLSINVLESWQNQKIGTMFISEYFSKLKIQNIDFKRIEIIIKRENITSINAFIRAGCEFERISDFENVKLVYINR